MKRDRRSEKVYLPTLYDIDRECEKIQKGWSERERLKRSGRVDGRHWSPPIIDSESLFSDWLSRTTDVQVG